MRYSNWLSACAPTTTLMPAYPSYQSEFKHSEQLSNPHDNDPHELTTYISIERILYETVKLHGDYHSVFGYTASDENHFAVAVSSRPTSFFEAHVKNLCLTGTMTDEHASRVLSVCTGVRNLALWKWPSDLSQVVKPRLRSLDTAWRPSAISRNCTIFFQSWCVCLPRER